MKTITEKQNEKPAAKTIGDNINEMIAEWRRLKECDIRDKESDKQISPTFSWADSYETELKIKKYIIEEALSEIKAIAVI